MNASSARWCVVLGLLAAALPVRAVEFGEARADGKRVTVCRVDPRKEQIRLFLRDDADRPFERLDALAAFVRRHGQTLPFAMNAGMFHADLAPVGLCVVDGLAVTPLNTAPGEGNFFLKPNGVFCVSTDGTARVVETSEFPGLAKPVRLATQSGPLLVRGGKIHPAFRADSSSRLRRNGVGVTADGGVVFAVAEEPVNLSEFAACFRDTLHCPDALYLDGAISSLYAPALQRNDFRVALGPMIGVVQP